jgi:hypothetical protein
LIAWLGGGEKGGKLVVCEGDKVDKQTGEAKIKDEDERIVPVLLREGFRQCHLDQ